MSAQRSDIRKQLGLRPVINVSGTMTSLGASIAPPSVVEAVSAILSEFVEIDDLQRKASAAIARLTAAEAGCVTASASAGITMAVAGAMTGCDLQKVRRLPEKGGLKNQVMIQSGHLVSYGAPVEQAVRLAGADVVPVGSTNLVETAELEGAITEHTAAALFVVSHHTVQYGMLPLEELARVCHASDVPVIADVASEYDLRGFLAAGADVAVYSAHKFLGGPTAGIVAGNKALVQATYLQNLGIGRGMKVGKEGIVGTIAALEAWDKRDHAAVRATETGYLKMWQERLRDRPGLGVVVDPDPTGNPLDRLRVSVDAERAGVTAWELARRLEAHDPPIIVRDHEIERGFFYLDPCNLHEGEAAMVSDAIVEELDGARSDNPTTGVTLTELRGRRFKRRLAWPN